MDSSTTEDTLSDVNETPENVIHIEISVPDSFTDKYVIQAKGQMSFMSMIPPQWIKREARRRGISREDLCDNYKLEWIYNSTTPHAVVRIVEKNTAR